MIALIQRVLGASVTVDLKLVSEIQNGLLVFLSVRCDDTIDDAIYLAGKTVNLRIFSDEEGKMNLSVNEKGYELLVISQFTLHAETKRGNRPSFVNAAEPILAQRLYNAYLEECRSLIGSDRVKEGIFAALMKIKLINDGPVTILLKSKNEYQ